MTLDAILDDDGEDDGGGGGGSGGDAGELVKDHSCGVDRMMERLQHKSAGELIKAKPGKSPLRQSVAAGKWNEYYSRESVEQRALLLEAPAVKAALDRLWAAATFHDATTQRGYIDRDEYLVMHRKIVLALEPTTFPAEAEQAGLEDWERDSEGGDRLDQERFQWSWFELADLWTESMEADEYVEFLQDTASLVTRTTQAGEVVWCGSRFQMASLLPEDSVPSASLDHLRAPLAPAHPGAPPERLGSLR